MHVMKVRRHLPSHQDPSWAHAFIHARTRSQSYCASQYSDPSKKLPPTPQSITFQKLDELCEPLLLHKDDGGSLRISASKTSYYSLTSVSTHCERGIVLRRCGNVQYSSTNVQYFPGCTGKYEHMMLAIAGVTGHPGQGQMRSTREVSNRVYGTTVID